MNDIYPKDEYCMMFSNEEIIEYLINPLKEHPDIFIALSNKEYEIFTDFTREQIYCISFDKRELFHITFNVAHTAIAFTGYRSTTDEESGFGEDFLFIDDNERKNFTSSDTYGKIVYGGVLRDKTHKEILELLYKFIVILVGVKNISTEEIMMEGGEINHLDYNYIVRVTNDLGISREEQFENITFLINK